MPRPLIDMTIFGELAAMEARYVASERAEKARPPSPIVVRFVPPDRAYTSPTDPIAAWKEAVAAKRTQGLRADRAVSAVDKEQPGLRQRMLVAYNAARGRVVR